MSKKILLLRWLFIVMAFVPFITQAKTTAVERNADSSGVNGTELGDDYQERIIYSTDFQDWETVASSTTPVTVEKKTYQNKDLTFTLLASRVAPNGTDDEKFTSDVVTPGYIMTEKKQVIMKILILTLSYLQLNL